MWHWSTNNLRSPNTITRWTFHISKSYIFMGHNFSNWVFVINSLYRLMLCGIFWYRFKTWTDNFPHLPTFHPLFGLSLSFPGSEDGLRPWAVPPKVRGAFFWRWARLQEFPRFIQLWTSLGGQPVAGTGAATRSSGRGTSCSRVLAPNQLL